MGPVAEAVPVTAVLCDDEPLMREVLRGHLARLWPALQVLGEVGDGPQALQLIRQQAPALAFLDIRMPGLSGLEVAQLVPPQTQVVFVTAHDEYALQAFEAQALDYLLKPVDPLRLARLVTRLQQRQASQAPVPLDAARLQALLAQLQPRPQPTPAAGPLTWLQVAEGTQIRMLHIDDVMYFESDSKYTRVLSEDCDGLIRLSLKELLAAVPTEQFLQVHRSVVVNRRFIRSVLRRGEVMELELKGSGQRLRVSESNHGLFKAM